MPNTIAQNLQRLVDAKDAISEAITAKGGTVSTGDSFEDFPTDIASIPSGGSGDASKPVKFIDYDGSIVASYTPEEFAELTEMPANPSHDGLTAQGWNWNLTDAKSYVQDCGRLDIGQMYTTSDGNTRLYIYCNEITYYTRVQFYISAYRTVSVDWGDGSVDSNSRDSDGLITFSHKYNKKGFYTISIGTASINHIIKLQGISGRSIFYDDTSSSWLYKVEIGNNVEISSAAFVYCRNLLSITIPNTVTTFNDSSTFYYCTALKCIIIPDSITNKDWGTSSFEGCENLRIFCTPNIKNFYNLQEYSLLRLIDGFISNDETSVAIQSKYDLKHIAIPSTVTNISITNCYCLEELIIPANTTDIQSLFNLINLKYIKFKGISPPAVSANTFLTLQTTTTIYVPAGYLDTYKNAAYYPDPTKYTYEEY